MDNSSRMIFWVHPTRHQRDTRPRPSPRTLLRCTLWTRKSPGEDSTISSMTVVVKLDLSKLTVWKERTSRSSLPENDYIRGADGDIDNLVRMIHCTWVSGLYHQRPTLVAECCVPKSFHKLLMTALQVLQPPSDRVLSLKYKPPCI